MRTLFTLVLSVALVSTWVRNSQLADALPVVRGVELQPLAAQAKRVAQALELVGSPLVRPSSSRRSKRR